MKAEAIKGLKDWGVVIESHNIFLIKVLFLASIPREAVINATISLMHVADYDCHEIETLPDGSVRLTVHLDS